MTLRIVWGGEELCGGDKNLTGLKFFSAQAQIIGLAATQYNYMKWRLVQTPQMIGDTNAPFLRDRMVSGSVLWLERFIFVSRFAHPSQSSSKA